MKKVAAKDENKILTYTSAQIGHAMDMFERLEQLVHMYAELHESTLKRAIGTHRLLQGG
jgi:hypothetical protein